MSLCIAKCFIIVINASTIRGLLESNRMNRGVLGDSLFCSCFGGERKEVKPNWWGFYNLRRCVWGFEWQAVQLTDLTV